MKVVQILGGAEDGGLEKHTIELSHSLKDKDIKVTIIANERFRNNFKKLDFLGLDLSKGRNNPFILYKLYKILKQRDFDIIHTQANKATDMVVKLKPFLKAKVVSTLHSYKKNIKSFEKSDFVITVSDKIGKKIKNKNKKTIYNGTSFNDIDKIDLYKKYNIPKDRFIICSVGRFVKVKNFDLLLKGLKETNAHLILVGDGYEKNRLIKLSKEIMVKDKITFTGYLKQTEVKKIIKSSHLFVMTSKKEGFPYTFIESMFCNTPFISTDVSDIKKFITSKYIISICNPQEIAKKITFVQNNYNEVLKDYKEIFSNAKKEFSVENMTDLTVNIYKKIINDI